MIISPGNKQITYIQKLQKKRSFRKEEGVYVVEGERLFSEVSFKDIVHVYMSSTFLKSHPEIQIRMEKQNIPVEEMTDGVFQAVSDTVTPQGVLAIVRQAHYKMEEMLKGAATALLLLDNLQDPGNLGTVFRTAEGAGVSGILLSRDTVDLYNPKVVRATMGAIYRVPFLYVDNMAETIADLRKKSIQIFASTLEDSVPYDSIDYTGPYGVVVGNEGQGIRRENVQASTKCIHIPMEGKVESLNAAVAASVILFEGLRQRRMKKK